MRNDYGNRIPYAEYAEAFSRIRLPLIIPSSGVPNLEPLDEVWPTGTAPIIGRLMAAWSSRRSDGDWRRARQRHSS